MTHCRAEVRRARVQVLRVRAPRAARARSVAGPAMPVYGDAPCTRADGLCGPRP